MNVWTYWKCPACHAIIRGDSRTCPSCGTPIPEGTKYLMPDNPEVVSAVQNGTVLIQEQAEQQTVTDEKGIKAEVVSDELKSDKPNWNCPYCGYQNRFENTVCESCGAGKEESEHDYFGNRPVMNQQNQEEYQERTGQSYIPCTEPTPSSPSNDTQDTVQGHRTLSEHLKRYGIIAIPILIILFLIWLFIPVTRSSVITGFEWERSIAVETFTCCHENGWSLPEGAVLTSKKQEIHHYNSVLDHYEKKSKQVAEQVLDGYDVSYCDLGNGQAERVETPRYRTEYHTEYYDEPVYRQVPEYRTKYYYDIGRWKQTDTLVTAERSHTAYWYNTDIPTSVGSPDYGDKKHGSKAEEYYAVITDENGEEQRKEYSYSEWQNLSENEKITYKTFRFSQKPL